MERTGVVRDFKGWLIAAVIFLVVSPLQLAFAQPYDTVYQLYYEINKSPSRGDDLIQSYSNRQVFDPQFYNCLNTLLDKFQTAALNRYQFCDDAHRGPNDRAQCKKENEPAKMHHWLRTIDPATRGQVRWSGTFMGQAQVMAEQMLSPAEYRRIVESTIPKIRPQLMCK